MPVGIMEEIRPHLLVDRWARYISVKSSSQIIKQNNDWKLLFSRVNNQIIGSVEQGWLTSILQPVFFANKLSTDSARGIRGKFDPSCQPSGARATSS